MNKLYNYIVLALVAIITFAAHSDDKVPQGKYIFVPDSLQGDVLRLLKGHSRVVDNPDNIDLSEKVLWRGDTVPMVLKSRNFGRHTRGLSNFLFIPRQSWSFGLTASYGEVSTKDMEMFDLIKDVNIGAHAFSVKPYVQYAVGNNLALGLRLGYSESKAIIDRFKVDLMEDMNFSLKDIKYQNQSFAGAAFLRQYIGLSRRGRFGIFNELELSLSGGNSDFSRPVNDAIKTTHTRYFKTALNFSPGVSVFIMRNASFDVSVGALGFNLKTERQAEDGVDKGSRTVSGMSFRWNLFNINFGIGIHI